MRMLEVNKILQTTPEYIVVFDTFVGKLMVRDSFPDILNGEEPIKTKALALSLAEKFASKTEGEYFNVHIADAKTRQRISGINLNERY